MKQIVLFITVLAVCAVAAPGDREEIRKTALDYIDKSELHRMGAMSLVQRTRSGGGKKTPNEKRTRRVKVLDIYENAASVRVEAAN